MRTMSRPLAVMLGTWIVCGSAFADITVPGANGSDGIFNPTANVQIDLSQALPAAWDAISPMAGKGVYDGDKWAVVFHYASVNIPSNVTVTFTYSNPLSPRAPVVWLVSGPVNIAGTVSLNGTSGHQSNATPLQSEPGPGGFRGGRGNQAIGSPQSAGFGPGGTRNLESNSGPYGGSYGLSGAAGSGANSAGPTYGNASVLPLMGGSGGTGFLRPSGGATAQDAGGGAGGGAILIAATQTITIAGTLRVNGGGSGGANASGGSGGAIRLVAHQTSGGGIISAFGGSGANAGGTGGSGIVRIESNANSLTSATSPNSILVPVGGTATVWPPSDAPLIRVAMVHNQTVPTDPRASLTSADVMLTNPNPMTFVIECINVPTPNDPPPNNSAITLRIVPKSGRDTTITLTADNFQSGNFSASTWQVPNVTLADGFSGVQARVVLP